MNSFPRILYSGKMQTQGILGDTTVPISGTPYSFLKTQLSQPTNFPWHYLQRGLPPIIARTSWMLCCEDLVIFWGEMLIFGFRLPNVEEMKTPTQPLVPYFRFSARRFQVDTEFHFWVERRHRFLCCFVSIWFLCCLVSPDFNTPPHTVMEGTRGMAPPFF